MEPKIISKTACFSINLVVAMRSEALSLIFLNKVKYYIIQSNFLRVALSFRLFLFLVSILWDNIRR